MAGRQGEGHHHARVVRGKRGPVSDMSRVVGESRVLRGPTATEGSHDAYMNAVRIVGVEAHTVTKSLAFAQHQWGGRRSSTALDL